MAGDTKKRILEAALELFAQSGYLGTSMSDIAGQLGITKGALYKHYVSKQELPTLANELMGDVERYKDFFAALEKTSPFPIAFEALGDGIKGRCTIQA